jgi:hypothetical protein
MPTFSVCTGFYRLYGCPCELLKLRGWDAGAVMVEGDVRALATEQIK